MELPFPFGARVTVHQKYDRKYAFEKSAFGGKLTREWVEEEIDPGRSGIFLGLRTLANGVVDGGYDEPRYLTPTGHVRAAVVCCGPRENTFYAPIDALTPDRDFD